MKKERLTVWSGPGWQHAKTNGLTDDAGNILIETLDGQVTEYACPGDILPQVTDAQIVLLNLCTNSVPRIFNPSHYRTNESVNGVCISECANSITSLHRKEIITMVPTLSRYAFHLRGDTDTALALLPSSR